MPNPPNISDVVSSFYAELKTVAADLNAVSDELGKSVEQIDAALKNLNLGITVWMEIRKGHGNPDLGDDTYWIEEIGYAKSDGRWGICLRKKEGDEATDEESCDVWLFNDAPRGLRLVAIDHLVGLLQKLTEAGQATAREIRDKLAGAQEVAASLAQASQVQGFRVKGARTTDGKLYKAMLDAPLGGPK